MARKKEGVGKCIPGRENNYISECEKESQVLQGSWKKFSVIGTGSAKGGELQQTRNEEGQPTGVVQKGLGGALRRGKLLKRFKLGRDLIRLELQYIHLAAEWRVSWRMDEKMLVSLLEELRVDKIWK